jgi:thymidylate synthase (FAD)
MMQGFVKLVDVMGTEAEICEAARVSYGDGTKTVSDDVTLIRYLMRHRHTTPFEMVELKFLVSCPMDVWRQWIRHRTANVNEYSTRYSQAIDEKATTNPDEWRLQSGSNKQGSTGLLTDWPEDTQPAGEDSMYPAAGVSPGEYLSAQEADFHFKAEAIYKERLAFGIAREQARKDLPLSTFTRAYWKIDLHNLLHFLSLRMDSHAQLEIREYANSIGEMVSDRFPNVWEAFLDYRFGAVNLTRLDQLVIRSLGSDSVENLVKDAISNKREQQECLDKLKKLKLI